MCCSIYIGKGKGVERSVHPPSLSCPFSVLFGCTAPHNGSQGEGGAIAVPVCANPLPWPQSRLAGPFPVPPPSPPAFPPASSTPSPSNFTAAGAAVAACSAARTFIAAVAVRNASVTRRVRSAHCAEEQGCGDIAKQINKLLTENLLNVANGPVQQTLGTNIAKLGRGTP